MLRYQDQSIQSYLDQLASRNPVPGGGSAAALVGAVAVALISMVANYSLGRGKAKRGETKMRQVLKKSKRLRQRLLTMVDLDAEAYLKVVQTRQAAPWIRQKARQKAREIPLEICRLCYAAVELTPELVRHGNPHLLSDVKVALEMLSAAFHCAMFNVEANQ